MKKPNTKRMDYESLKDLPNDSYITIEVNGNKTRYDIHNITPEFWQFINEVATSIETTILNDKIAENEVSER